ncbi:hypothetical protein [Streptomyces sp. NPDC059743]|uniref:hypothetical protein n=1 Tax=Streptomyces sp. NPDC059743 TaxID=3346928 RepID=UPI00364A85B6
MSLLRSADVFKAIESQVSQLFYRQLICPHEPGEKCSTSEHLTLSEAKEAAARHASDAALRDAVWRCVGRYAHSDNPDMAHRGQLLALWFAIPYLRKSVARVSNAFYVDVADVRSAMIYGALCELAVVDAGGDVREEVMRAANSAGWEAARMNTAERTTDPRSLVDRRHRHDDDHEFARDESDVHVVGEVDPPLRKRISGERLGATLHGLGVLEEFLSSNSEQASESDPDASSESEPDASEEDSR